MKSRILNIDNARFESWGNGDGFEAEIAWLGAALGSRKLGFNITVVPPGKRAFPCHAHHANEEMFFILEGNGRIRIGDDACSITAGDFISLPPGREYAHQIVNDSDGPLRYLAVSTMEMPEITEYPDSGKQGLFAGSPPGRAVSEGSVRRFVRLADGVGYWEGEE